ncbi:MAG: DegT/DnrJ/EryC1/StrS family aminotransferase, partial [Desulfohalobiaceae bacterium]
RMDELQAAFLIHKLNYLDDQLKHRRKIAEVLIDELPEELHLPPRDNHEHQSAWHLFVVHHPQRDRLEAHLRSKGIQCLIHYPRSIDQHNALKELNLQPCAVSRKLAGEILSLPIGPHIDQSKLEYMIKQVRDFFGK